MHSGVDSSGSSKFIASFLPVNCSQVFTSNARDQPRYQRMLSNHRLSRELGTMGRASDVGSSKRFQNARTRIKTAIPSRFWSVFPYETFNVVQSNCLEAFRESCNMVVSAPTGSGKTVIFELAICRVLNDNLFHNGQHQTSLTSKIVYLAPIKALCSEKAREWRGKFSRFGVCVQQITGDDTGGSRDCSLSNVDVICTTPEKWDSLTRQHSNRHGTGLTSAVSLILVDEIHHLNDERGSSLEAVLARMMLTSEQLKLCGSHHIPVCSLRIIAASATIPNVTDIAEWIKVPEVGLKQFDESVRPVKLEFKVLGYRMRNAWTFDKYLNSRLLEVILKYSNAKPVLVFCPTRKSTYASAAALTSAIFNNGHEGSDFSNMFTGPERAELATAVQYCTDKSCREYLPHGIAIHNGGLVSSDRQLIEELFRRSVLKVIFTTTTLSQGVNLPAHLVIVKSTQIYVSGKMREIDRNIICQMLGRAGRPQFDDSGVAVIMTAIDKVRQYELICRGARQVVESQLRRRIPEHINAEIGRGTISDVPSAIFWLKRTFLRIRMRKNPRFYNLECGLTEDMLEEKLKAFVVSILNDLATAGLITYDTDGFVVSSTEAGQVMAQHYISFKTMKMFYEKLKSANSPVDILKALVEAEELVEATVLRRSEKRKLNEMNRAIRFPLPGKVKTTQEKIFCLLQASLSEQHDLLGDDAILRGESQRLLQIASRVSRSLAAYLLCINASEFSAAEAALRLKRSLDKKVWWDGGGVVRQLPGVGLVYSKQLISAGVHSIQDLAQMHPRKIEAALKKNPPFGNALIAKLNDNIPCLSVEAKLYDQHDKEITTRSTSPGMYLKVTASVCAWDGNSWKWARQENTTKGHSSVLWCFLLVGCHGQAVLHHSRAKIVNKFTFEKKVVLPSTLVSPSRNTKWIEVRFGCESFVGVDAMVRVSVGGDCECFGDACEEILDLTKDTCGHYCKDKRTCRHQCCKGKTGKRKRKASQAQSPSTPPDSLSYLKRKAQSLTTSLGAKRLRDVKKQKLLDTRSGISAKTTGKAGPCENKGRYNLPILVRPELHRTENKSMRAKEPNQDFVHGDNIELNQVFRTLAEEPEVCLDAGKEGELAATHREFDEYNDAIESLFQ